jgi:hypothetical protein
MDSNQAPPLTFIPYAKLAWDEGDARKAGVILTSNLAFTAQPFWAAGVLNLILMNYRIPLFEAVYQMLMDDRRWVEGDRWVAIVREARDRTESAGDLNPRAAAALALVEAAAEVAWRCSPIGDLTHDSGACMVAVHLHAFALTVPDPVFHSESCWLALTMLWERWLGEAMVTRLK